MKITRIDLYQVEYKYTQKYPYMFSGGRSLDSFTSAVVWMKKRLAGRF